MVDNRPIVFRTIADRLREENIMELGIRLGVSRAELEALDSDCRVRFWGIQTKCMKMLEKWDQRENLGQGMVQRLVTELQAIGRRDVATLIETM